MLLAASLLALAACTEPKPEVQSPAPGAQLKGDWAPVMVLVPRDWKDAVFSMTLDGEPFEDRGAYIRRAKGNKKEPGSHLLATLPLDGLEPGPHRLEVRFSGVGWWDKTVHSEFVTKPRKHRVTLRLDDGQGVPVNARVVVRDRKGSVRLTDASGWKPERKKRNVALDAVYVRDGLGELRLGPGWYHLVATRGLRDAVAVAQIQVEGDTEVELSLPRLVETPGALAADLHVHTGRSYDVFVPDAVRLDSLACAGIDVVAVTDHNRVARSKRLEDQLAGEAEVPWLIPGVEGDMRASSGKNWDWGHLTAWPLAARAKAATRWPKTPAHGVLTWQRRQARNPHPATGEDLFITLAHPRGIQFRSGKRAKDQAWALFNNLGYDRETPVSAEGNAWMLEQAGRDGPSILDVDAIEVVNRMGLDKYRDVRLDWFALLNQGFEVTGMGNSDSHALAVELVGWPLNMIHGGIDPLGELDLVELVDAARQGRVSVTTGPILELELVAGERRAGLGDTITPGDEPLQAVIRVRHPPWVPVHELRLVHNGQVIHSERLVVAVSDEGPAREVVRTLAVEIDRDGWLLAEAGWPEAYDSSVVGGTYAMVAPGYVPFAFTNPIRVDADGDGTWTPPGLPEAPAEPEAEI